MDSVNLSETQTASFNCQNTASNTSPVPCVCCGSKNYMQAFPPAYCFAPFHPGTPKCKRFQDNCEENLKFQHSFFPNLPFFHPFFHNIAIPPNFCWVQNHSNDTAPNKQKNQTSDHEYLRTPSNSCNSCPPERNEVRGNDIAFDEAAQKQDNLFTPETPLLEYHFNMLNLIESQLNSFFQRFACDSSIPWTFSPFIAPIISYCLLWNSQRPNMSASTTNFTTGRPETLSKRNNDNSMGQKLSNNNNNNNNNGNKVLPNIPGINGNINNNLTGKNNCSQEDGLEIDQQVESNDQNSGKSSTFMSLNSLNSYKHLEKENHNRSTDICVEEGEDTETEGFDFEDHEESDECPKTDKKYLSNKNSNDYFLLDSNYNHKENECQSPLGSPSYTNLKAKKNNLNSEEALSEDIPAAGEKCFNSIQDSDDECIKITPQNAVSKFKEQMPSKKLIKNFTVTDQTDSAPLKEEQISVAAAGDLGGENFVGYITDISSFEENNEAKARHESQSKENSEPAETLPKDMRNLEEKISDSFFEKSLNETFKNGRTIKSSIAKLSKLKDPKPDPVKNIKQNKEFNQNNVGITKRKHNCLTTDNNAVAVLNKSMKIQKTKNCTVMQQHFAGSKKQHKETTNKIQTLKREEKSLTTKFRPLSITQKTIKNTSKK